MTRRNEKATGYVTFNKDDKQSMIKTYGGLNSFDAVERATASIPDYLNTRHGFHKSDYLDARPQDIIPSRFKDVINACRSAYLRVNIVRNVIDLMTDFACEDLKIIHPDKKVEAFFKVWIAKVGLKQSIDEFVRHFLIDANVVVKRHTAKISKPVEEQWVEKAMAQTEVTEEPEKLYKEKRVNKREIPWRYTFLNVASLYWLGGEEARASGERRLAFRLSDGLIDAIRSPNDPFQQQLVSNLPINIRRSIIEKRSGFVELDMDRIYVAHNKKDSWEDWAPPFLYSILGDIHFKDKLRQAEHAALDGTINVLRLWKLGDHTEGILPAEGAIDKLVNILQNNTGGGAVDIVWDSLIDMQEFYPPVDKILGSEKYQQVNRDILIGLGVPEVLIGGQGANFSNSWIQLKTLVEKLNYVRDKVKDWLYEEIHLVCQAMDIPIAPKVRFNQMNLEDENVARKLIVGLLDRNIISVEAVLQVYGEDFLIEVERMRNEETLFKKNGVERVGPFTPPDVAPAVKKGVPPKKRKGQPGRPFKTPDVGRDTRTAKPRRAAANLTVQALDIMGSFDKYVLPIYMEKVGVDNARKLTDEQREEINKLRTVVLCGVGPNTEASEDFVLDIIESPDKVKYDLSGLIRDRIAEFTSTKGSEPNFAQRKIIEAMAWAEFHNKD